MNSFFYCLPVVVDGKSKFSKTKLNLTHERRCVNLYERLTQKGGWMILGCFSDNLCDCFCMSNLFMVIVFRLLDRRGAIRNLFRSDIFLREVSKDLTADSLSFLTNKAYRRIRRFKSIKRQKRVMLKIVETVVCQTDRFWPILRKRLNPDP